MDEIRQLFGRKEWMTASCPEACKAGSRLRFLDSVWVGGRLQAFRVGGKMGL
jgi:hypothetical protein